MKKYTGKKLAAVVASVLLIGFGVSLFVQSDFGVDPFSSMNMGLSGVIGTSFGIMQLSVNILLFLPVLIFARHKIGIGTIANMVFVAFIADFMKMVYGWLHFSPEGWPIRIVLMVMGVAILSLGASLYYVADLGVSPYDAAAPMLSDATHIPFRWCRIVTDLVCVLVSFLTGGPIGIGTVVTAFFMGPLVSFFNRTISEKLVLGKDGKSVD